MLRAGFSLSRALFRKKCGALQLGRHILFFLEKKLATFFSHHGPRVSCQSVVLKNWRPFLFFFCSSLLFHSGVAHFSGMEKFAAPFVGAPFCGAPVRPNMLNMPKSAAENAVEWKDRVYTTTKPVVYIWWAAAVLCRSIRTLVKIQQRLLRTPTYLSGGLIIDTILYRRKIINSEALLPLKRKIPIYGQGHGWGWGLGLWRGIGLVIF